MIILASRVSPGQLPRSIRRLGQAKANDAVKPLLVLGAREVKQNRDRP